MSVLDIRVGARTGPHTLQEIFNVRFVSLPAISLLNNFVIVIKHLPPTAVAAQVHVSFCAQDFYFRGAELPVREEIVIPDILGNFLHVRSPE